MTDFPTTQLLIDNAWREGCDEQVLAVENPATGERLGTVAKASRTDLAAAVRSALQGFEIWRKTPALERSRIMRRAAELLRERVEVVARIMTLEQGKPIAESRAELEGAADTIDWFAEEARRTYGRVIPARQDNVRQLALREPIGPVAAFTPWNFPVTQAVRKIAAALAAGCSVILKGPEETPASCAEMVRTFIDAGLPKGVLNLVYGEPSDISSYLISDPAIRKISFTGSVPVGCHLAALAGQHMKRSTMELGGHAPAIVCDDANIEAAAATLAANKFRNAGQVCISPSRILVQSSVFDRFVECFLQATDNLKVGHGLENDIDMGPLVNQRRLEAVEALIDDARDHDATLLRGGERLPGAGYFLAPTVLTHVPHAARLMNEEPFGPVAVINSFDTLEEAIAEANRLPFGLAAYAWTRDIGRERTLSSNVECGMIAINHHGLGMPENPFGGVKDSGYGSENGIEAMEAYLSTRFVTVAD